MAPLNYIAFEVLEAFTVGLERHHTTGVTDHPTQQTGEIAHTRARVHGPVPRPHKLPNNIGHLGLVALGRIVVGAAGPNEFGLHQYVIQSPGAREARVV